MRLKKSLKGRLAISYLIIIMMTMVITDFTLVTVLRSYFNDNVREALDNQLSVATSTYEKYYSEDSLEDNVANDEDSFWRQTRASVQIINLQGEVILDTTGNRPQGEQKSMDILGALEGTKGSVTYNDEVTKEKLMAVSHPLISNGQIVGVLRFITSLHGVDETMNVIILNFIVFGLGILLLTAFISQMIGKTIIAPIEELTKAAETMAKGNYNIIPKKFYEDEIGQLSDTLNHMAMEIKKKESLKNDFISSVSHELRTPLTSIKGWAITLKDPQTDPKLLNDGLEIITKESDRLTFMVDELLDFSKFVSGKITLDKEVIEVEKLFDFIETNMADRSRRENKVFTVEKTEGMGTITADMNRVKQVFINLLDNAFKFTGVGGKINLSMVRGKQHVDFVVSDNGSGISKSDILKVKEKFYKGKTSKSTNGIGLSICDEIAILHGGELIINSEVGVGTEIIFRLPEGGDGNADKQTK